MKFTTPFAVAALMATQGQAVNLEIVDATELAELNAELDAEFVCGGLCVAAAVAGASGAGAMASTACYTYGTTVLRKGEDGKSEAVAIEALKEGDQVLVNGASGLHFSPAVAVSLHADAKSQVLTLSTRSGHQVTLTDGHMVPVQSEGKEELLPARDVKVGSHLTVVNDAGNTELSEIVDISAAETTIGLANVITGPETIVVNGIVGSVHAETTFKGVAGVLRPVVKLAYTIGGARAARYTFRAAEAIGA